MKIVPPEEGDTAFTTLLRIARKQPPLDDAGWQRWSQELVVFLKHMSGDTGDWQETVRVAGKADATFRFRMRGEKPTPKCSRCGADDVIEPGLYKFDICRKCAIELANQEVAGQDTQETLL